MDVAQFLISLLHAFSALDFVEKVDLHREVFILKGRVILKKNRFLQIYFNEITETTAFALVEGNKRIWGVDFDKIRGWHMHPLENPETHRIISSTTIEQIVNLFADVWKRLP